MAISSAPRLNSTSSAPALAIAAASRPPSPGTKPRSRPPTRAAAVCRTDSPRQVPAAPARFAAVARTEPPSGRASALPHDDQRLLGFRPDVGERLRQLGQRLRPGAEIFVRIGQVVPFADQSDREGALQPALADAGVEDGRFLARVRADDQQRIRVLDARDGRVEEIEARPIAGCRAAPSCRQSRFGDPIRAMSCCSANMSSTEQRSPASAPILPEPPSSPGGDGGRKPPARSPASACRHAG